MPSWDHIRTCFMQSYPENWAHDLRKPFKEAEWESAETSAASARALHAIEREYVDDFELLGVNHF